MIDKARAKRAATERTPMDTLLFLLILGVWYAMYRSWSRTRVIALWTATLVVTVLLLKHHVTDSIGLNF